MSEKSNTIKQDNLEDIKVLSKSSSVDFFINYCEPHHLNNHNVKGYDKYLQSKLEGRWLVYSWEALIMQPFFFIFHKMYLFLFAYAAIIGLLGGLHWMYPIGIMIIMPFFAYKLYEIHANCIYLKSFAKYEKFKKKYAKHLEDSLRLKETIEKIEQNTKISEKKKAKLKERARKSLRWNYLAINHYDYFFDKISPLGSIKFFPFTLFYLTIASYIALTYFMLNSPEARKVIKILTNEVYLSSPNASSELSPIEKKRLEELIQLKEFSKGIYAGQERYLFEGMLEHYKPEYKSKYKETFDTLLDGKQIDLNRDQNTSENKGKL